MSKLWSFIVSHFKSAWNSIAQWFQKPRKLNLVTAIIFLMLALVLTSALVVDNLYIKTVHTDHRLNTLFQWTAYVSQSSAIVFIIAFGIAGLCLLTATVRVYMAQARERRVRATTNTAIQQAKQALLNAAAEAADQLTDGMASGSISPEVAVPLLAVTDGIIQAQDPTRAETNALPRPSGTANGGDGSSLPAPESPPPLAESLPAAVDTNAPTAVQADLVEVEEGRLSE